MEYVLNEVVSSDELEKFERVYNKQLYKGKVTQKAQFEYAWCLVRSKNSADIRNGVVMLEGLFLYDNPEGKKDYFYHLAIGNARIEEYGKAFHYVRAFLQIEPENQQVQQLGTLIKNKMEKELFIGSILVLSGWFGLELALALVKSL